MTSRAERVEALREAHAEAAKFLDEIRKGIERYEQGKPAARVYHWSEALGTAAQSISDALPTERRRRCEKCKELRSPGLFMNEAKWCDRCVGENWHERTVEVIRRRLVEYETVGKKAEARILRKKLGEMIAAEFASFVKHEGPRLRDLAP